jgi:hypothetical protein
MTHRAEVTGEVMLPIGFQRSAISYRPGKNLRLKTESRKLMADR